MDPQPIREVPMRIMTTGLLAAAIAALGCPAAGTPTTTGPPSAGDTTAEAPEAEKATLRFVPLKEVPPARRVWAYVDGVRKQMDIDDARSLGLTVVDLSDDWVPYIFWSKTPNKDDYKLNQHLDFYTDLANDRIDVDGVALPSGLRNYLEVYGIPPSLGVLRRRFLKDADQECYKKLSAKFMVDEYHGPVRVGDPRGSEWALKRYKAALRAYKAARRRSRIKTLEGLLASPKYGKIARAYQRLDWQHRAIKAMQDRLACEDLFGKRRPKLKPHVVTWAVRQALRRFEKKHNIYGWGLLFEKTAKAIGRSPLENNHNSLRRVLTERVTSAARILEDGTVGKATYVNAAGKRVRVRNLVKEFSAALVEQLGLTSPEKSLAFIRQYDQESYKRLFVAVKLPPLPEYYSPIMDLSMVVDRGDVWYDFPFNEKGKRKVQPRRHFPHQTLFVNHGGKKIPLVRWRTTIGGWQPEMRHDEEYYKYKISDVGPRVWKKIVAGPVWIPPKNTPSRDMVKRRPVGGRSERIVAHRSFGPGYASAYGLVAAYHVTKGGRDNQVRTHGSVNYMSIRSRNKYSHGCHRLFNFRAVRLFSFVLGHRNFKRVGQTRLALSTRYDHRGEEFQMDLRTRGYYYIMTPPIEVNVLEGNIRGDTKEPIKEYVKKPTTVYQDDIAKSRKDTTTSAPRRDKPKNIMKQPQDL